MKMKENGKKRVKAWSSNLSPENGDDIGDDKRQKKKKESPIIEIVVKAKKKIEIKYLKKKKRPITQTLLVRWTRGAGEGLNQ